MKKLKIIYCETHNNFLNMVSDYKMTKKQIKDWGDGANTLWMNPEGRRLDYLSYVDGDFVGIDLIRYNNIPKTKKENQ